jgi:hypothetical protein
MVFQYMTNGTKTYAYSGIAVCVCARVTCSVTVRDDRTIRRRAV